MNQQNRTKPEVQKLELTEYESDHWGLSYEGILVMDGPAGTVTIRRVYHLQGTDIDEPDNLVHQYTQYHYGVPDEWGDESMIVDTDSTWMSAQYPNLVADLKLNLTADPEAEYETVMEYL
jgi:hypothetical protein